MEATIEVFETTEPETGENAPEMEAEALELIERLELEGQRERLSPNADGETERNPFPQMTKEQERVYEAVCGAKTDLREFNNETIPLRVLKTVERAEPHFEKFKVWHQAYEVKDPLVVGYLDGDRYMIARWGSELVPFSELREKAIHRKSTEFERKAREKIGECRAVMENAQGKAVDYIEGEISGWSLPF